MSTEFVDAFAPVEHSDEKDTSVLHIEDASICNSSNTMTEREMLDYMVTVLARSLSCATAFKGGYMLNQLLGDTSRLTHDVDFSIMYKKDYEQVKSILRKIGDNFVQHDLISHYKIKEDIESRMSGGADFYAADGSKVLGVDVGLHDISWGTKHYSLSVADVEGFTIERMLSDKLIAITTRARFRRTKDLYDFYAITDFFDVDLHKLNEYVILRGGAQWENIPFNDVILREYEHAWEKLVLENSFGTGSIEKPPFEVVLYRYYKIALPLKSNNFAERWDHKYGRCI